MSTLYIITPTTGDDTINPFINILPGALNGPGGSVVDSDLRLYGQGTTLYGEGVNENLYRLSESFACPEKDLSPGVPQDATDLGTGNGVNAPLTGQPWYNTTTKKLLVYDATSAGFISPSAPAFGGTEPSAPIEGDLWYDSSDIEPLNHQLKVYEGAVFVSVAERYVSLDGANTMYGNLTVETVRPQINLKESDVTADNGLWSVIASDESLSIAAVTDDGLTETPAISINRTGTAIDSTSIVSPSSPTTPIAIDDLTRKDYVDDNFVADVGGTMSGALVINNTLDVTGATTLATTTTDQLTIANTYGITLTGLALNVGNGLESVGPDIEMNASGLIAADNNLFINIATGGASGDFIISEGDNVIGGTETALFTVERTGRIKSNTATYETLVDADDVLTNKKYVDDEVAAATGALGDVPRIWTTLSASALLGDIAVNGGIIYINLADGNNFKQVWPAIYA